MKPVTTRPLQLGVLASHNGTTLQAILDAIAAERLAARVCVVISNNSNSGALRRAMGAAVPTRHLSSTTHPDEAALDRAIVEALTLAGSDVVFLAGYMKRLGPSILARFEGRILNTHPALLPKFGGHGMYGTNVHRAVLAAGESESGASIHLVEAEYDTGRVLQQARVPVEPSDTEETLADRVQTAERQLVVDVLSDIAEGRLTL
jgi:phosphoribosylglycinamide formyltransferase-1